MRQVHLMVKPFYENSVCALCETKLYGKKTFAVPCTGMTPGEMIVCEACAEEAADNLRSNPYEIYDAEGKPLPPTCEMCGQWMFRKEIQERYAAKLNRELNTEAAMTNDYAEAMQQAADVEEEAQLSRQESAEGLLRRVMEAQRGYNCQGDCGHCEACKANDDAYAFLNPSTAPDKEGQ